MFYKARISPNALTQRERLLIHNHPVYGQTLATFLNDLKKVGSTIRAHHERWDGKGYPDGLAGENIPCTARLLAVIVYYVECGLPREEAIDNILNESGNAFEPSAVRLFLKASRLVNLPSKVKEILFSELKPDMILAQDIKSPTGLLLIPEGATLNNRTLNKIQEHNTVAPFDHRLLVYV